MHLIQERDSDKQKGEKKEKRNNVEKTDRNREESTRIANEEKGTRSLRVSQLLVDGVYTVLMGGSKEERKTDKETKLFSMRLQRGEKRGIKTL